MQIVWELLKKEQRREIAIYKGVSGKSIFSQRPPVRSKRVRIWTREEVERENEMKRRN